MRHMDIEPEDVSTKVVDRVKNDEQYSTESSSNSNSNSSSSSSSNSGKPTARAAALRLQLQELEEEILAKVALRESLQRELKNIEGN
jgi:hypothetical protein